MKKLLIICAVATFTASAWAASETIASTNLNSVLVVVFAIRALKFSLKNRTYFHPGYYAHI